MRIVSRTPGSRARTYSSTAAQHSELDPSQASHYLFVNRASRFSTNAAIPSD